LGKRKKAKKNVFPYLIGTPKASGHSLLAQKQNWAG